jgi:hypothetical protein
MPAGVSAYTALANVTLGSSATTVTFSSISGSYRDLVLVANGLFTASNHLVKLQVNADTGANYSTVYANSTPESQASSGDTDWTTGRWDNTSGMLIANIMDYSATDKHKTCLSRRDSASFSSTQMNAHRWANTAAITSVKIFSTTGSFATGTTFSLYGVSA